MEYEVVEAWIRGVADSHSDSSETAYKYRHEIERFCQFVGKKPAEILKDIEVKDDRQFKRHYTPLVNAYRSNLSQSFAKGTVSSKMGAIKSFFKYNSLPLDFVPQIRIVATYHNRDITKEEIQAVLNISSPRSKAFFCIMAQSGIRPDTLCELKFQGLEPDWSKGVIPCKIHVKQEIAKCCYREYYSFMSDESVKYLKAYLQSRPPVTAEDYLFTQETSGSGDADDIKRSKMPVSPKSFSEIFKKALRTLKERGVVNYEVRGNRKPSELKLYCLRKYFRKYANQAGFEFVQYWMGHIVRTGVEESYRPLDPEFHRKLYEEKAMPFLRFEISTPNETAKLIEDQRKEIEDLKRKTEVLDRFVSMSDVIEDEDDAKRVLEFFKQLREEKQQKAMNKQEKEVKSENADFFTQSEEELVGVPKEHPMRRTTPVKQESVDLDKMGERARARKRTKRIS
ncbi:MAG TPA: tyrosine-type recombinase/integrase [Candidatus Bathyarchaeia archaeon]|nr:tyrosine-type recombinase/integrase [Candidatus Bathyarchaeia archaeon]